VFDPNSPQDVIANSGPGSNASFQTHHGNSHALPHEAVTPADVNFGVDSPNGANPHETVIAASELDPAAAVTHVPPGAEARLHVEDTPASAILASAPAAGESFAFEPNSLQDVITDSGPASNASLQTHHGNSHGSPNDAQDTPASAILASAPAAGESFVFEPNSLQDVITDSGPASNASLQTHHGNSHASPNEAQDMPASAIVASALAAGDSFVFGPNSPQDVITDSGPASNASLQAHHGNSHASLNDAQDMAASAIVASALAAGDSFVFGPNSPQDAITDSGPGSNASLQAHHGNSHASPNDAQDITAGDSFVFELETSAAVSQPPRAEGSLHLQGTPANTINAGTSPIQQLTANDSFVFQANFGHDATANSGPVPNASQISPTVFADLTQVVEAAHEAAGGSMVIATDVHASHPAMGNETKQHHGDFHVG
jgi:hypothetical protein